MRVIRTVLVIMLVGCGDNLAAEEFRKLTLTTDYVAEGIAIGDIDGDGRSDVIAGPRWYGGPGFDEAHEIYPPVAFDPFDYTDNFLAFTRDLDGDGALDVLVVGFPGTTATVFTNPRADAPWSRQVVFDGVDGESPDFTDVDGDGAPELVLAHAGRLGWAEPGVPGTTWTFVPATPDRGLGPFSHGLGVGDVDGDGALDLVLPDAIFHAPAWTAEAASFGIGGAQIAVRDVDGDGDGDVITTLDAHGYGVAWFEATADGYVEHAIAPASPDAAPAIHEPHALVIADIDGDGLDDVVTGERFWGHVPPDPDFSDPAALYWFQHVRDAGGDRFVPHLIDDASGVGTQIAIGDVDGDGRLDIAVANKKGAFVFVQSPSR